MINRVQTIDQAHSKFKLFEGVFSNFNGKSIFTSL